VTATCLCSHHAPRDEPTCWLARSTNPGSNFFKTSREKFDLLHHITSFHQGSSRRSVTATCLCSHHAPRDEPTCWLARSTNPGSNFFKTSREKFDLLHHFTSFHQGSSRRSATATCLCRHHAPRDEPTCWLARFTNPGSNFFKTSREKFDLLHHITSFHQGSSRRSVTATCLCSHHAPRDEPTRWVVRFTNPGSNFFKTSREKFDMLHNLTSFHQGSSRRSVTATCLCSHHAPRDEPTCWLARFTNPGSNFFKTSREKFDLLHHFTSFHLGSSRRSVTATCLCRHRAPRDEPRSRGVRLPCCTFCKVDATRKTRG
jgi:hypothetical protein